VPIFLQHSDEYRQLKECYENIFETIEATNNTFYVVALIEAENEVAMKEYLLKPWKRLSIL